MTVTNPAADVGVAHLPAQRRKIAIKQGADFNIMVVGHSGAGKSTFINTLFCTDLADPKNYKARHAAPPARTTEITVTRAELEERGFTLRLTVIDTPGFGDGVNNRGAWAPAADYIDAAHAAHARRTEQPHRAAAGDGRVHACVYFISTLTPLDIQAMQHLGARANLVPVIAKADTRTPDEIIALKRRIRNVVAAQGIRVFQPPLDHDDDGSTRALIATMPFALIGSTERVATADGRTVLGRAYDWGVAEVENEAHCDFRALRALLLREHMLDLVAHTDAEHYARHRAEQPDARAAPPRDNARFRAGETALKERLRAQIAAEDARFQQWERRLIQERDRLNADLANAHAAVRRIEHELEGVLRRAQPPTPR